MSRISSKRRVIRGFLLIILLALQLTTKEQVSGQERPAPSPPSEEEVKEAERLSSKVTALIRQKDYAGALPLALSALQASERAYPPEHPKVASAYAALALLYLQTNDLSKAEQHYLRALAIQEKVLPPGDPDLAESVNNLGFVYYSQRDYTRAEPLFQRALQIEQKGKGLENVDGANILANLGLIAFAKSDFATAGDYFRRAITIQEKLPDVDNRAVLISYYNGAFTYYQASKADEAKQILARALNTIQKIPGGDPPEALPVLATLVLIYTQEGNYDSAYNYAERGLALVEGKSVEDAVYLPFCYSSLANLIRVRKDYKRAESLYQRALDAAERILGPQHPFTAEVLADFGGLCVETAQYAKAEGMLTRALEIFRNSLGTENRSFAKCLANLAVFYLMSGKSAEAESTLKQTQQIYERLLGQQQSHLELATTLNNLAVLYHTGSHFSKAEPLYRRAIQMYEESGAQNHPRFADALANLSALYTSTGQINPAISLATRAADIEEHNLDLILAAGSEDQRRSYWSTLYSATMREVSLHARHALGNLMAAKLALTAVLRRKGRVLDALAESMQTARLRPGGSDPSLQAKLSATRSHLAALVLGESSSAGGRYDPNQVAELEKELQRLEAALSADGVGFRNRSEPVTVEGIQRLIPEGAALIEYFSYAPFSVTASRNAWQPRRYIAYIIKKGGEVSWAELGDAASIDADAMELRVALRNPATGDFKRLARRLDERIMRPIRRRLGKTRSLLVSPDGYLQQIPFEALIDEQGRYLTRRYLLTYLSSGRDLRRSQLHAESRQPPLIIANPDFDKDSSQASGSVPAPGGSELKSNGPLGIRFERLDGTEEEARQISRILPQSQILIGAEATEAALSQAHGPSILHVATHGFFPEYLAGQQSVPFESTILKPTIVTLVIGYSYSKDATDQLYSLLRSGIVLAGANTRGRPSDDDGILTALEATSLDLWGTKLVVLSACETGISNVDPGYGAVGLRRALMLAGAESQLMSLWKVDDKTTRDIMIAFYSRLRAGDSRAEALRKVRLSLLSTRELNHPYYWASFILSGDWR